MRLIRDGAPTVAVPIWADLGAGDGAFSLALADVLPPGSTIYAVDKAAHALRRLRATMAQRFPQTTLHTITADFTMPLQLPPLDGLLMANSLHFVRHKRPLLTHLKHYLQPNGRFILVEYNADRGNTWVPYPVSYASWLTLAQAVGWRHTRQIGTQPSRFMGEIFTAVSWDD